MSEITIVAVNLVSLAIAYLYLYPKYASNDIKKLAWLDVAVGGFVLLILAPFNWDSPSNYSFFTFEISWWLFAIASYALLELPLFYFYMKARGLGKEYLESFKVNSSFTTAAGRKSVEKQLVDTKWDGLRSSGSLKFLVIATNAVLLFGTVFLIFVGDNIYASYILIHVVLLFVFWALLRQAVRLIPDAPSDLLDERMLRERDSVYFTAYQRLGLIVTILLIFFIVYVVTADAQDGSDGFNYQLEFTWPQSQAIFWFVYSYTFMLPSMIMAWRESRRTEKE
jgi:hypothetical protein